VRTLGAVEGELGGVFRGIFGSGVGVGKVDLCRLAGCLCHGGVKVAHEGGGGNSCENIGVFLRNSNCRHLGQNKLYCMLRSLFVCLYVYFFWRGGGMS